MGKQEKLHQLRTTYQKRLTFSEKIMVITFPEDKQKIRAFQGYSLTDIIIIRIINFQYYFN